MLSNNREINGTIEAKVLSMLNRSLTRSSSVFNFFSAMKDEETVYWIFEDKLTNLDLPEFQSNFAPHCIYNFNLSDQEIIKDIISENELRKNDDTLASQTLDKALEPLFAKLGIETKPIRGFLNMPMPPLLLAVEDDGFFRLKTDKEIEECQLCALFSQEYLKTQKENLRYYTFVEGETELLNSFVPSRYKYIRNIYEVSINQRYFDSLKLYIDILKSELNENKNRAE